MSPHISYSIELFSGRTFNFYNRACFSGLSKIIGKEHFINEFDSEDDEVNLLKDKMRYVILEIRNVKSLPDDIIKFYFDYLFNHKGWSDWFINKDFNDIMSNGVKVRADIPSEYMISTLSSFRMVDECPEMVISFYELCSLDYKINKDLAFMFSHFLKYENGFYMNLSTNSNHHIINKKVHDLNDIKHYCLNFPYVSCSGNFNETSKIRGVYDYFNRLSSKSLSDSNNKDIFSLDTILRNINNNIYFINFTEYLEKLTLIINMEKKK